MFDREEIIECLEMRKRIHYNDDINKKVVFDRCVEIMSQDEEKAIQFIKEIYLKYSDYMLELIGAYFDATESKVFVKSLWQFFREEDDFEMKKDIIDDLNYYVCSNDWEEEKWFSFD